MSSHRKVELSHKMKLGVGRAYTSGQIMKLSSLGFLTIAGFLAINAIRLYHNAPDSSSPQGQVLGVVDTAQAQETDPTSQFIEYTAQKGDTLFSISQKYNIAWTTLATLNNLEAPFTLQPGKTKLKIPRQ